MKIQKEIIEKLLEKGIKSKEELSSFKREIAKIYKISFPTNIQLLKAYHELVKDKRIKRSEKTEKFLRKRPIRSLSGIVNVSVLTKPYPCPGKCIYCPKEKGIPKSYLSGEPAVERAKELNFDPYAQAKKRIEMLKTQGHPIDKIDLRIIGGTWSYYPKKYQTFFIKKCFEACNNKKSKSLETAQKENEKAKSRIIGFSVETRPDFIDKKEIKRMRLFGITKVELGVQILSDKVLTTNKRGHKVMAIIKATKILKDAGFKVSYQMMPNLPGSNEKTDIKSFSDLFENPAFKPDFLKIYPCALVKESPLYNLYLKGKYEPYSKETLTRIIKEIKKKVPYYTRIERIIRDIPSDRIVKGPSKISNLREVVLRDMKREKWKCKCIRCREIRDDYNPRTKLFLFRQDYESSGGKEIFLSFEDKKRNRIHSLLRLRLPGPAIIFPSLKNSSLIREIHTFGQQVPISKNKSAPQHKGLGKKLMKEAEKITRKEFKLKKIAVISAIGSRPYYRKLGYRLKETYMIKTLPKSSQ